MLLDLLSNDDPTPSRPSLPTLESTRDLSSLPLGAPVLSAGLGLSDMELELNFVLGSQEIAHMSADIPRVRRRLDRILDLLNDKLEQETKQIRRLTLTARCGGQPTGVACHYAAKRNRW